MGTLKVKWNRRAQRHFDAISDWYAFNMGKKAAKHFAEDTRKTTETLSNFPLLGRVESGMSKGKTLITAS